MKIDEINAGGDGIGWSSGFGVRTMVRRGATVSCVADSQSLDVEKIVVQFETES
jgi:hypothetical protein